MSTQPEIWSPLPAHPGHAPATAVIAKPIPHLYFLLNQTWIVQGEPGWEDAVKRYPQLPIISKLGLEIVDKLIRHKIDAQYRLSLLSDLITELARQDRLELTAVNSPLGESQFPVTDDDQTQTRS